MPGKVKVFKLILLLLLLVLCSLELIQVFKKFIRQDSYQMINELHYETLLAPVITFCPATAWKKIGPFRNNQEFEESTYTWDEIFHPDTLAVLRNESLYNIKVQYASYYGLCFVLQKLKPEKVSDYSFQIVVNDTLDYNYYLHEPQENEYLLMSVYPYEVPIVNINAANNDGIGGADIIYKKEIIRKLSSKSECRSIDISSFAGCIRNALQKSLETSDKVNCSVPAMNFTSFDFSHLNTCATKDEALAIEGLIYNLAIENHVSNLCGHICERPKYRSELNFLSKRVLSKELKQYGDGYYIIWAFYSTLNVNEKIETYVFDFTSALVAVGGSLGLFVGWSIFSMVSTLIDFINLYVNKRQKL